MNASRALLGIHVPGTTAWHRMATGWKYGVFLLLTVPAVVTDDPRVVLGLVVVSLGLVATTRAPLRLAWGLPWGLAALLAILAAFHVLTGNPGLAVRVVGTLLVALYAARILLITTPLPALVDALVAAARPLARVGLDPERFGLAVAIALRSIPFVVASFGDVRDAARARGLDRNVFALVTPVVIQTVAFARATGDALVARGLGEEALGEGVLDAGASGGPDPRMDA